MSQKFGGTEKPFGDDTTSAQTYLLEQLAKKYGESFKIIGNENLTDYPLHGVVYSCDVVPTSDDKKIFQALVDQSLENQVRDNFATYYFEGEVVDSLITLCENTEYVTAYRTKLIAAATEKRWTAEDDFGTYASELNAYVDLYIRLVPDKTDLEYASIVLNLLKDISNLNIKVSIKIVNDQRYIFFQNVVVMDNTTSSHLTLEKILEGIASASEIRFKEQSNLIIKTFSNS